MAMRLCLCAATAPDHALSSCEDLRQERIVEEAVYAASKTGFRCLELSIDAVEGYLAVYPLVVLDAFLAEHGCHIGVISGLALDVNTTDPDASALAPGVVPGHPTPSLGEPRTGQWSMLQARLVEVCVNLDGLGGGILTLGNTAGEPYIPALQALSALAQPYDVQIALECDAAGSEGQLSLAEGTDLLQAIRCPNVGLAYTVDETGVAHTRQTLFDELVGRAILLRCPVTNTSGVRSIVESQRSLCSIQPPAGLDPLEAAQAAADYAASMGCALTWKSSPSPRT